MQGLIKFTLYGAFILLLNAVTPAAVTLVKDGQATAVIVVAAQASAKAMEAAGDFSRTIAQMTGATLPILPEDRYAGGAAVLVGPSTLAARRGVAVAQGGTGAENHDHYVIRTGKNFLALIGNDSGELTGTAYAVYDLLQRLGCGWYGVDPKWVVIPKTRAIRVPSLHVDERPAFYWRELGVDLGLNAGEKRLGYAWRLDNNTTIFRAAHNLHVVVDKTRCPQAWARQADNPCLTDPAALEAAVAYCRQQLEKEPGLVSISFTAADSDAFCDCANCVKAGNISARLLGFANAAARALRAEYPGRFKLDLLAYWVSHAGPNLPVKAEPEVRVMIVNEGDHLKPLEHPDAPAAAQSSRSNARERRAIDEWMATGGLCGVYEWWIPSAGNATWQSVPWYSGETALKNLRYWHARGIRYMDYETFGFEKGPDPYPLRWPLYCVGARGMWNPGVTAAQVMQEACAKLFGTAAKPMLRFYRTIERAAMETDEHGGNWGLGDPRKIYPPAVRAQARACLQQALQATRDPAALVRIQDEAAMWDAAETAMAAPPAK